jgi:hypothetical protein
MGAPFVTDLPLHQAPAIQPLLSFVAIVSRNNDCSPLYNHIRLSTDRAYWSRLSTQVNVNPRMSPQLMARRHNHTTGFRVFRLEHAWTWFDSQYCCCIVAASSGIVFVVLCIVKKPFVVMSFDQERRSLCRHVAEGHKVGSTGKASGGPSYGRRLQEKQNRGSKESMSCCF